MADAILRKLQESTQYIVDGETDREKASPPRKQPQQQSSVVTLSKEQLLQYEINSIVKRDKMMQKYKTHSSKSFRHLQGAAGRNHNRRRLGADLAKTTTNLPTKAANGVVLAGGRVGGGTLPPATSKKHVYKKAKQAKALLSMAKKLKTMKQQKSK